MASAITLTGYGTRKYVVDLASGTATEEKIMRRTGKRYAAKVTNAERLRRLIARAQRVRSDNGGE